MCLLVFYVDASFGLLRQLVHCKPNANGSTGNTQSIFKNLCNTPVLPSCEKDSDSQMECAAVSPDGMLPPAG